MAFNGKQSDISNWYSGGSSYVPQPRHGAVKAPPASQIPGLGDQTWNEGGGYAGQGNQNADSDYARLAKRGGQSDLLHHVSDSSVISAQQSGGRRNLAKHKPADWYCDNDTQQQDMRGNAQAKWTHGGPAAVMQRQSNGYDEPLFNESYGEGMLNMDRPTGGNYNDYNETSDRVYGGADRQASGSTNNKQTYDYEVEVNGYNYAQGLPKGDDKRYSKDQDFSSALGSREVRQTPQAYSTNNQSDYSHYDANNTSSNNNNSIKSSASINSLDNPNHHHVNRMKREHSNQSDMSKLLSFGYVADAPSGKDAPTRVGEDSAVQSRFSSAASNNSQSRLNKSASHDALWNGSNPSSAAQEQRGRRKPADERPDFFRIGQDAESTSVAAPQFGRRKASAESFTSDNSGGANSAVSRGRPTFGLTKREQETRPDFLTIGSRASDAKQYGGYSDDVDVLDTVAGYGMPSGQRSDFRRQKMDPTVGMHFATPLRSANK